MIKSIHDRMITNSYSPREPTKLFFPKASGVLRPYTLLCVEDQIVYQAFANVIAERLYAKTKSRYNRSVFGGTTPILFAHHAADDLEHYLCAAADVLH
jgi:hypothetical protein